MRWQLLHDVAPPGALARYMREARLRADEGDLALAELLDAVENVPDLLIRWPDLNEAWVLDGPRRVAMSPRFGLASASSSAVRGRCQ